MNEKEVGMAHLKMLLQVMESQLAFSPYNNTSVHFAYVLSANQ